MAGDQALIVDCRKLPVDISSAAEAIVRFVSAQSGSDWEMGDSGRWRPKTANPVTLKPQWQRAKSLAVTLRGNPSEFEIGGSLDLIKDQNGYSAFRLERADQIADAFTYIQRAYVLFNRGRTRSQTTPKTIG